MGSVDVVIIDDDEGIRWIMRQALSLCNLSCSTVGDAAQGISAVSRCHPRLAIVDIKLGAMNGLEVAQLIRQVHDDVKILFVTGYREMMADQVETGKNIVGVLEKPFNVDELLRLVGEAMPLSGVGSGSACPRVYDRMDAGS